MSELRETGGEIEHVGSAERILSQVSPFPEIPPGGRCRRCGEEFPMIPVGETSMACPRCERREVWAARFLAARDETVARELVEAGLARREREATLAGIPGVIRKAAGDAMRPLLGGVVPDVGFGLIGTPGIGKTMALAAVIAELGRKRVERLAAAGEFERASGWLAWLPWPEVTARIRAKSLEDDGHVRVNEMVERWSAIEVVVIDDLGAERMGKAYLDDWATSQLDRVLVARERACRPLWWTSNIGPKALAERYGSRFWSRLDGMAPAIEIGKGEDLRRRRVA